jgi:hypothetical protein
LIEVGLSPGLAPFSRLDLTDRAELNILLSNWAPLAVSFFPVLAQPTGTLAAGDLCIGMTTLTRGTNNWHARVSSSQSTQHFCCFQMIVSSFVLFEAQMYSRIWW